MNLFGRFTKISASVLSALLTHRYMPLSVLAASFSTSLCLRPSLMICTLSLSTIFSSPLNHSTLPSTWSSSQASVTVSFTNNCWLFSTFVNL
uniref:Putative secreted peptide n=1 Tax=Anopheles braziliensis TaxID=58242 RepID=A0A2M3ZN23_9DIPT